METRPQKRKAVRRSSANYYITAEDHVDNEVKHERLLTETSRLSSSWASLRLSGLDKGDSSDYTDSLPGSAGSSPTPQRPHSFSGPLVISVTCSSSGNISCANPVACINSGYGASPSSPILMLGSPCHASPAASPVSSRVQCYSPGIGPTCPFLSCKKSYSNGNSASPLFVTTTRRKRAYPTILSCGNSSTEASRESSPDPFPGRSVKTIRPSEPCSTRISLVNSTVPPEVLASFRWPPMPPSAPFPSSPSTSHSSVGNSGCLNAPSSPSTASLPSPRLSLTSSASAILTYPSSPSASLIGSSDIPFSINTNNGLRSQADASSDYPKCEQHDSVSSPPLDHAASPTALILSDSLWENEEDHDSSIRM
ncbi:unnamed protein product [Protopolystoma xenopodis]|uniref:Uncharacterized protein n=1 Tax=Protopolystoma xenopodis TaxID=117903 RepID=A0A448WN85_9PLAT|nr:unnamed protein product [Protopolystoma xenopodis]